MSLGENIRKFRIRMKLTQEELAVRARLVQANMRVRRGQIAEAARVMREIDQWAKEIIHGAGATS